MSVNVTNTDRRQLREYLLGQLPEELASQFDASLFAGDALRQELEDEQSSLVEDSVYGRLMDDEEMAFQAQCVQSPLLREKVAALRVLVSALERQQDQSLSTSFFGLTQMLTVLSTALALAFCFTAFLHVREHHGSPARISQRAAPVLSSKDGEHQSGHDAPIVTAFLPANVVRGTSALPTIKIPPAGTVLELQIEVHSPLPAGDWDVELVRGSEVIQSSSHAPLHRLGQEAYLSLTIDAVSIHAGYYYSVRYSPHSDPGAIRNRSFQVVN